MKFSNTVFLMLAGASCASLTHASAPGGLNVNVSLEKVSNVSSDEILLLTRRVVGNRLIEKACGGKVMPDKMHITHPDDVQKMRAKFIREQLKEMQDDLRPVAREILCMDSGMEKAELKEYVVEAAIALLESKTESKRISEFATQELKKAIDASLDTVIEEYKGCTLAYTIDNCRIQ